MSDKEDYLTGYRVFFENFAATVNPEDQLPVNIAGYTITEAELPGEVLYWTTQYLTEKQCPLTLLTPLRRIILDEVRVASKDQPNDFGFRSEDGVYIALKLMQAVMARINGVCLRYLDNSRLDTLPAPPPPAHTEYKTVSIAAKNSRRVMEDRHVEIGNLEALFGIESTEQTSFYAVYDGHAGSAAATYCAAHLHQYLVESPHFTTDLKMATRDAYLRTDAEFVRKSNQERACGGSTAVSITIRGRQLMASWAGDSQALLVKRMRLIQLVRPHKPNREDERDRIENTGGAVLFWGTWRVNGQLAVSRAIGDAQYKPYVTANPEMTTIDLDGDEDFLVVACDGLWDFVSEDVVALAVYMQLAADPDDLKAVTKRLVLQAKKQHSTDNISIIVVFLKDPRDIVADNPPPMDLGLDNALANAPPPFVMETDVCKRLDVAPGAETESCAAVPGNGVDSDSDSDDLGPETAVDDDDMDGEKNHRPAPPTPPAHTVESSHVDGGLVDNVAESGEESEDEWNYFKGEGEPQPDDPDELPRSETPLQDNSGCEDSSVDMNSSPLNPEAPVFVPGVGSDVLLAESPRKPLPMDDIELPDSAQFRTEAVVRPADLLDLDNCDQLNGHHNISLEGVKEHLNGNGKCDMDSLGFGFNVGVEPEKVTDTALIQDFERIQKDTTDFCNIQVFQAHNETNPFATEGNEELLERLKNKERDPMSMSFYQEKDDDTCERVGEPLVDLNAVQPLPDSDDDDNSDEKENISPLTPSHLEPNNDILSFDDRAEQPNNAFTHSDNYINETNNMHIYSNIDFGTDIMAQEVMQTDTPESHKLLIEQIPEIPEGKSMELSFKSEDVHDPLETEHVRASTPQDEDMEQKEDSPSEESQPQPDIVSEASQEKIEVQPSEEQPLASPEPGHVQESLVSGAGECASPARPTHGHIPQIHAAEPHSPLPYEAPARSPLPSEVPTQSPLPSEALAQSPLPSETLAQSPLPSETLAQSPLPSEVIAQSPLPSEDIAQSPLPSEVIAESPLPSEVIAQSPIPGEILAHSPLSSEVLAHSPLPSEVLAHSPLPSEALVHTPLPSEAIAPCPLPDEGLVQSPLPSEIHARSPLPSEALAQSPLPTEAPLSPSGAQSPAAAEVPLPRETPERASPAPVAEPSGPAPDIVPDEAPAQSRAQEICVPVTSEILPEDSAGTPPPTPAAQPALSDAPIAADIAPPADRPPSAAAELAVAAVTAAVGAAAAVTASARIKPAPGTPAPPRKPATPAGKTTPKPAAKAAAPRTPASATAATRPPAKTTPARTPGSAPRTPSAPASASKPASAARPAPAKASPVPRPAPKAVAAPTRTAAPKAPAPAKPAPKPASAREPLAATKSATSTRAAPAARPAPKPAAPRPASAPRPTSAPAKPAPRPAAARPAAPRPAPARPAAARPKPLTNGDAKPDAPRAAPARPAPRAAPPPRPTPRAPALPAAATNKSASAPKPLPRARPAPRDADKLSKDLANKRITAKAAPPRTQPTKQAPATGKVPPIRAPIKKADSLKKEAQTNGVDAPLTNGAADAAEQLTKPPPSPPAADNALLPDVIA